MKKTYVKILTRKKLLESLVYESDLEEQEFLRSGPLRKGLFLEVLP